MICEHYFDKLRKDGIMDAFEINELNKSLERVFETLKKMNEIFSLVEPKVIRDIDDFKTNPNFFPFPRATQEEVKEHALSFHGEEETKKEPEQPENEDDKKKINITTQEEEEEEVFVHPLPLIRHPSLNDIWGNDEVEDISFSNTTTPNTVSRRLREHETNTSQVEETNRRSLNRSFSNRSHKSNHSNQSSSNSHHHQHHSNNHFEVGDV